VVLFLLRSAARGVSLSRFQYTTMKASGISANRYLTLSSSSSSGSGRSSTGNGNSGSIPTEGPSAIPENLATSNKDSSTDGTKTAPLSSSVDSVTEQEGSSKTSLGPSQSPPTAAEYVYVHPLSQIVLLHLQSDECHEWIRRAGLDRNLTVHRDGTFSLETLTTASTDTTSNTANTNNTSASSIASARIWTAYCPDEKKHWLIYSNADGDHGSISADDDETPVAAAATTAAAAAAATTTVRHRFLLQDNLKTAWNGDKNSLPVRIQEFVSELMLKVR
jgi:hypothetical protein